MSELKRAEQRLADNARAEERARVEQARLKEEERKRLEKDYQERVKPALLSAQKNYWNENVPARVVALLEEVVREIESRERNILKGAKLRRAVSFEYVAHRGMHRTVQEDGECDQKETFVQDWRSGNLEKSATPKRVSITYEHLLQEVARGTYLTYCEGLNLSFSIDAENIFWSYGMKFDVRTNKSDEALDHLAEELVHVLNARGYYYCYESDSSPTDARSGG